MSPTAPLSSDLLEGNTADRELASSRWLAASPELVYRAWTDPAHLVRWWGPKGFTNEFEHCDPRPGGHWKFVMVSPDGARFQNESVFRELVPGKRLVIDHVSPPHFLVVLTLTPEKDGTRAAWRQIFETKELCEKIRALAEPANEENFDRLAAELATMR